MKICQYIKELFCTKDGKRIEIRSGRDGYYMYVFPKCGNSAGIEKRHFGCMTKCRRCDYQHLIRENDGTNYAKAVGISPLEAFKVQEQKRDPVW